MKLNAEMPEIVAREQALRRKLIRLSGRLRDNVMEIYRWLIDHVDILGLSIDFIALIVTIFLTVGIYKLERRHEKEREKAEKRAQESAII